MKSNTKDWSSDDDDEGTYIEIFRLVSGQTILAELERPIEDIMASGDESFVALNPVEILYYEREEEDSFEEEFRMSMNIFMTDYLADFGIDSIVFRTMHIMTYGLVNNLMRRAYIELAPKMKQDRKKKYETIESTINENGNPIRSERNVRLYDEILASFEAEDDTKPN